MKLSIFLFSQLFIFQYVMAMGWFSRLNGGASQTEAGFCFDCDQGAFRGETPAQIPTSQVSGQGSRLEAFQHFQLFAQDNPECKASAPGEEKYGLITDMSNGVNGVARNLTYVVKVDETGKPTIVSVFRSGEGQGRGEFAGGVGNECGSWQSPTGFMRMTRSDYRADTTNPDTGAPSSWPQCGSGNENANFQHNRIWLAGMEPGVNDNLGGEANPRACPDGQTRAARLHPISYLAGDTTQGCKGIPLDQWCKWAPKLSGGCIYNYDGSESAIIRQLRQGSGAGLNASNR